MVTPVEESTPAPRVSRPARRVDPTLKSSVEAARAAIGEAVPADLVGEHLGFQAEGERVGSHLFACTAPGYRGWHWSVTVARASRAKQATIDEVVLLPGQGAIVAPEWVPYRDRVRPGDLSPGDVLPVDDDDPRLVPTYSFGGDDLGPQSKAEVKEVARDLYLDRVRTLSPEGRDLAAERWYDGDQGPQSPLAKAAPATCRSCGFLIRITGGLADSFGVCANGDANDDGRVVSLDHGCGAHSEVQLSRKQQPPALPDHFFDTLTPDDVEDF